MSNIMLPAKKQTSVFERGVYVPLPGGGTGLPGGLIFQRAWGMPKCVNGKRCGNTNRVHWRTFDHPPTHPRMPPAAAAARPPSPEPEPLDEMFVLHNWVGTVEAKSDYFLTPDDLRSLKYGVEMTSIGGGVGIGRPMNFYDPKALKAAAVRKHGEAGFKKKQEARKKRESKKRARED